MTEEKLLTQYVIHGRCPVVAVGRSYGDGRRQDPTESTSQKWAEGQSLDKQWDTHCVPRAHLL